MTRLYVNDEGSSSLTVMDPRTGKPTHTIPVSYPYNLYFTPDGSKAIVWWPNVSSSWSSLTYRRGSF